ncbi:MAG TPA: hypothetical protein DCQ29_04360, partial [Chitinophagaceae bacterium]|nr:hypothetical protein [Chitinophagaceae bacterium]
MKQLPLSLPTVALIQYFADSTIIHYSQPIIMFRLYILVLISLFAAFAAKAQNTPSFKIKTIPAPLSWYNQPDSFAIVGNKLVIVAGEKTDMFRDPNVTYNTDNAPKLLFEPAPNFVLTTAIQHTFTHKWDGGAIVLIEDSLHWIKFCFEKDYTGTKRVASVVTNNISDDCNSIAIAGNKVFYKLAKSDNVITLYASVDGKKWLLIRHLQFNHSKPLKVGFLAQSPTGKRCRVEFSNISY